MEMGDLACNDWDDSTCHPHLEVTESEGFVDSQGNLFPGLAQTFYGCNGSRNDVMESVFSPKRMNMNP